MKTGTAFTRKKQNNENPGEHIRPAQGVGDKKTPRRVGGALTSPSECLSEHQVWLPGLDGKRTQKAQIIQLLVAMYKYRGRQTRIVFGEPLPVKPLPPKPVLRNIIAEALNIKSFLTEDPQRTYWHAGKRFKVTKARISQLMKIAGVLPQEFLDYMRRCEDQNVIKRFSGKTLLRIAGLESPNRRQQSIINLMESIER